MLDCPELFSNDEVIRLKRIGLLQHANSRFLVAPTNRSSGLSKEAQGLVRPLQVLRLFGLAHSRGRQPPLYNIHRLGPTNIESTCLESIYPAVWAYEYTVGYRFEAEGAAQDVVRVQKRRERLKSRLGEAPRQLGPLGVYRDRQE